jgi:hypothetical protein
MLCQSPPTEEMALVRTAPPAASPPGITADTPLPDPGDYSIEFRVEFHCNGKFVFSPRWANDNWRQDINFTVVKIGLDMEIGCAGRATERQRSNFLSSIELSTPSGPVLIHLGCSK